MQMVLVMVVQKVMRQQQAGERRTLDQRVSACNVRHDGVSAESRRSALACVGRQVPQVPRTDARRLYLLLEPDGRSCA